MVSNFQLTNELYFLVVIYNISIQDISNDFSLKIKSI